MQVSEIFALQAVSDAREDGLRRAAHQHVRDLSIRFGYGLTFNPAKLHGRPAGAVCTEPAEGAEKPASRGPFR
jgi:hypothetical protein